MNYQIILDEQLLRAFIDWLPDLLPNETYYGCLFARKKYCAEMVHSSDKTQLKRFTGNKTNLFWKIKQLECELGAYRLKDREVPQEALALYMNPNPRDLIKASYAGIKDLADALQNKAVGFNPQQQAMSCIQRATGTKYFVDFDFDFPNKSAFRDIPEELLQFINRDAFHILETRGGFHVLVEPRKVEDEFRNKWHQRLKSISDNLDQVGDQLLPVPGCTQGGFCPHFI